MLPRYSWTLQTEFSQPFLVMLFIIFINDILVCPRSENETLSTPTTSLESIEAGEYREESTAWMDKTLEVDDNRFLDLF